MKQEKKYRNKVISPINDNYKTITELRTEDLKRMKNLYKKTGQVVFSETDHWVRVGNETFNGVSREEFKKIVGE